MAEPWPETVGCVGGLMLKAGKHWPGLRVYQWSDRDDEPRWMIDVTVRFADHPTLANASACLMGPDDVCVEGRLVTLVSSSDDRGRMVASAAMDAVSRHLLRCREALRLFAPEEAANG